MLKGGEITAGELEALRSEIFGAKEQAVPQMLPSDRPVRVGYIASSKMPSRAANNVHVMKMCEAIVGALP